MFHHDSYDESTMRHDQFTVDTAFQEPGTRSRADSLMTWGHAAAFAGSLTGFAGGLALVACGSLTGLIAALLVIGPVCGLLVSGFLYSAASCADKAAGRCASRLD
ncbi:hypothetical protein [Caenimonas koreensis]|uniref:Uncharacterized protein n=1 Tax=Caenimonas koreensis DSM 17982 TaxID=1121255 RepID=A0A844B195_9BURK|nr:hypothetical protein [Caenimonas koreensis]MRD47052.1 hypothetical protein [Caenimonas koreensis DSM 17982]